MPHHGDAGSRSSLRLESNGLRSRSRDIDVHDLIPPRAGDSSSTNTPSTHNSTQGVAGI